MQFKRLLFMIMSCFLLSGCAMKLQSHWQGDGVDTPTPRSLELLCQAQEQFRHANSEVGLRESIAAYENVLVENPYDYMALKQLSTQYILLGTAYTENRSDKSEYFHKAIGFAERAMYTNPAFRERVEKGVKPWEAADTLGAAEVEAMLFWVKAVQYEFKEVMSLPGKIRNVRWLQRSQTFLNRIEEVDPAFGGGAVEFSQAICYYALPGALGGSKAKGDLCMQQALAKGEGWLLPRWARGKYYFPIIGEQARAREELQWVAAQSLDQFQDPYPWRVYFQKNAEELLK